MAWWDHEELKSKENRSDRYITSFPDEYSPKEVQEAYDRINKSKDKMSSLDEDGNISAFFIKHTSDGGSTDYYNIPEGIKDLQGLIEYKNMNFAIGNIFKACYRMGRKEGNDDAYDLRKIIFFAERELNRIENE